MVVTSSGFFPSLTFQRQGWRTCAIWYALRIKQACEFPSNLLCLFHILQFRGELQWYVGCKCVVMVLHSWILTHQQLSSQQEIYVVFWFCICEGICLEKQKDRKMWIGGCLFGDNMGVGLIKAVRDQPWTAQICSAMNGSNFVWIRCDLSCLWPITDGHDWSNTHVVPEGTTPIPGLKNVKVTFFLMSTRQKVCPTGKKLLLVSNLNLDYVWTMNMQRDT